MHRICHKDIVLLYTVQEQCENAWPAQVSTVVANVGRELSLLKMAINMANADYLLFFLWNELEPRCQQRAVGSLELAIMEIMSGNLFLSPSIGYKCLKQWKFYRNHHISMRNRIQMVLDLDLRIMSYSIANGFFRYFCTIFKWIPFWCFKPILQLAQGSSIPESSLYKLWLFVNYSR